MILKEIAYNYIKARRMDEYIRTRCECEINTSDAGGAEILYITVAFNDAELIKYQHRLLKRFAGDNFSYLVADNSNDKAAAGMIREYCAQNRAAYIKLPDNPLKMSDSHAAALNWVCSNMAARLKEAEWVGFIDHDCFPIKEISVPDAGQEFYGLMQNREEKWYLWPGFCFFRTGCIDVGQLDFGCTEWGDTGSAMYETLYKKAGGDLKFARMKYEQVIVNENAQYVQEGQIEIFDDCWCHVSNGSNWLNVENAGKMDIVYRMLDKILA